MTIKASGSSLSFSEIFTEMNGPVYEGVQTQSNVSMRWWIGHPLDSNTTPGMPQDTNLSMSDFYSKTRYGYDEDSFSNRFITTFSNGDMAVELLDDFGFTTATISSSATGGTLPALGYGYDGNNLGPSNLSVLQGRFAIFTIQYKSAYTGGKITMSVQPPGSGWINGSLVNPSALSRFNTNGGSGANFTNYWSIDNIRFYNDNVERNLLNSTMATPMDSVYGGRNFQLSFRILMEEAVISNTSASSPLIFRTRETATGQTAIYREIGIYYGFV